MRGVAYYPIVFHSYFILLYAETHNLLDQTTAFRLKLLPFVNCMNETWELASRFICHFLPERKQNHGIKTTAKWEGERKKRKHKFGSRQQMTWQSNWFNYNCAYYFHSFVARRHYLIPVLEHLLTWVVITQLVYDDLNHLKNWTVPFAGAVCTFLRIQSFMSYVPAIGMSTRAPTHSCK